MLVVTSVLILPFPLPSAVFHFLSTLYSLSIFLKLNTRLVCSYFKDNICNKPDLLTFHFPILSI